MDEKKVFEIAYKVVFDRYCDALEAFDISDRTTVFEAKQASKELSDFEALAIEKGYEEIIIK